MFYVYILYSEKLKKYYKGYTEDISKRLYRHNHGYEKYTSTGIPWKLKLVLEKATRAEAMLLERKIKNLNRNKLEAFILKYGSSNPND